MRPAYTAITKQTDNPFLNMYKMNGGIEKFNFLSERHLDIILQPERMTGNWPVRQVPHRPMVLLYML